MLQSEVPTVLHLNEPSFVEQYTLDKVHIFFRTAAGTVWNKIASADCSVDRGLDSRVISDTLRHETTIVLSTVGRHPRTRQRWPSQELLVESNERDSLMVSQQNRWSSVARSC